MQIIFLAAGKSSRIYEKIKKPKSLVKLNKITLLESLVRNSLSVDIKKIHIVTGFQKKKISENLKKYKINFIHNNHYNSKDMLYSIYLALKQVKGDTIISYTDISYDKKVLKKLLYSKSKNIIIPILKNWVSVWRTRKKKISDDGESLKINKTKNTILEIGKKIKKNEIPSHQFMGILKIPNKQRNKVLKYLKSTKIRSKMQTTEFLNYLIFQKIKLKYLDYSGKWYEFDDFEDFKHFKIKNNEFY